MQKPGPSKISRRRRSHFTMSDNAASSKQTSAISYQPNRKKVQQKCHFAWRSRLVKIDKLLYLLRTDHFVSDDGSINNSAWREVFFTWYLHERIVSGTDPMSADDLLVPTAHTALITSSSWPAYFSVHLQWYAFYASHAKKFSCNVILWSKCLTWSVDFGLAAVNIFLIMK